MCLNCRKPGDDRAFFLAVFIVSTLSSKVGPNVGVEGLVVGETIGSKEVGGILL